jgi:hypothetical protein
MADVTKEVTKGNIVTGSDGLPVKWEEGGDNKVTLPSEAVEALKEAGVIK